MEKKIIISTFVLFTLFVQITASPRSVDYDYYRTLNNYGVWIEIRRHTFVWHPTIVTRFWEPYSIGRWYWTDAGWFWDADEAFVWITHNYGEWEYDRYYGWIWYPTSGVVIPRRRPFYKTRKTHIYRGNVPYGYWHKKRKPHHNYVYNDRNKKRHEPYPVKRVRYRRPR